MIKRIALASIAVFLLWSALDFVIHGKLLTGLYEATAHLWRPMPEMKRGLMSVVTFLSSIAFVFLYARFVEPKSLLRGLGFGVIYGLGSGIPMGYGSFSVMPIPYLMAFTWCWGSVVQAALAGLVTALIIGGGKNKSSHTPAN